jgi:conserved oligomeric Golgi complex subunit 5
MRNAKLFNSVHQLHTSLSQVLSGCEETIQTGLHPTVTHLQLVCNSILELLFRRVLNLVELNIFNIHKTDYAIKQPSREEASAFIRVLQKQLLSFRNVILAQYTFCTLLADHLKALCERVLVFFIRHAALVRNISDHGKLKLAGDMAQLEKAITPVTAIKVCFLKNLSYFLFIRKLMGNFVF